MERKRKAIKLSKSDEEFMKCYGLSSKQMSFFKAVYRREFILKIIIVVLLVLLAVGYARYRAVI